MNKPTLKTHEQTHDFHASTTEADRASMLLKKREQEKERAERKREKENYEIMREERGEPNRLKNNVKLHCSTIVYFFCNSYILQVLMSEHFGPEC